MDDIRPSERSRIRATVPTPVSTFTIRRRFFYADNPNVIIIHTCRRTAGRDPYRVYRTRRADVREREWRSKIRLSKPRRRSDGGISHVDLVEPNLCGGAESIVTRSLHGQIPCRSSFPRPKPNTLVRLITARTKLFARTRKVFVVFL